MSEFDRLTNICNPSAQTCSDLIPVEDGFTPNPPDGTCVEGSNAGVTGQDPNLQLNQDNRGLKDITGNVTAPSASKVYAAESPMQKKPPEVLLMEELQKIASFRQAFERGDLSFEGLAGAKSKVEKILGRDLFEKEWPESSSMESKEAILTTLKMAEDILRYKIIDALAKLVRPDEIYKSGSKAIVVNEEGEEENFYKSRKVSDGTPFTINYKGQRINFSSELQRLAQVEDPFDFIRSAGLVSDYARAVSVGSGLETLSEVLDAYAEQAAEIKFRGNILDDFTDANCTMGVNPAAPGMGMIDSADCQNARKMNREDPNYADYNTDNLNQRIKDFKGQVQLAKSLLSQGDVEGAARILVEVANSDKFKTVIPEVLGTDAARKLTEKLQLSVAIVIASGLLAKAAAAYCVPWIIDTVGAVRGAQAIVSAGELAVESVVFTTSNKLGHGVLLGEKIYDQDLSFWGNMGEYGKEVLFTAGMLKVIGSVGSVYKGLVLDKIPQNATVLRALAGIGGFVLEAGGFQSWDYIRNTIDKMVFNAETDPESAFAYQNCLEGVKFLLALKIGHFLAKPIIDPINQKVFKTVIEKFGPRLASIQGELNGLLQEIKDASEGKEARPADVVFKEMSSLLSKRLTLLKEVKKFGVNDPELLESIAETEAQLSGARAAKEAVNAKAREAERLTPEQRVENGESPPLGMDESGLVYLHGGLGGFDITGIVAKGIGQALDWATSKLKGPNYKGELEVKADDNGRVTTEFDPKPKHLFYTERYLVKQDGVVVADVRKVHGTRNDEFRLVLTPEGEKLGIVVVRDGKALDPSEEIKSGDSIKIGKTALVEFKTSEAEKTELAVAPKEVPIEVDVPSFTLRDLEDSSIPRVEGRGSALDTGVLFKGQGISIIRTEDGRMVVKTEKGIDVTVVRNRTEIKKGLFKDYEVKPGDIVVISNSETGKRYSVRVGTETVDHSKYGTVDTSPAWKVNVEAAYQGQQNRGEKFVIDQGRGELTPLEEARQAGLDISGPKITFIFDASGRVFDIRVDGTSMSMVDSTRLSDSARSKLTDLIGLDCTVPSEWHMRSVSQKTPNSFEVDGREAHWPAGEALKIGTDGDVKIEGNGISEEHVIITPEADGSFMLTPNGDNSFEIWYDFGGRGSTWMRVDKDGMDMNMIMDGERVKGESNKIMLQPGSSYRIRMGDKELDITVPTDRSEKLKIDTATEPVKPTGPKQVTTPTSPQFDAVRSEITVPSATEEIVIGRAVSGDPAVGENGFALREDGQKVKVVIAGSGNRIVSRQEVVLKKRGDKWTILHHDNRLRGETVLICRNLTTGKTYIVEGNKEGVIEAGKYTIEVVDIATVIKIRSEILLKYQQKYLKELGIDPEDREAVGVALKDFKDFTTIDGVAKRYPDAKKEYHRALSAKARTSSDNRLTINIPSEADVVASREAAVLKIKEYLEKPETGFLIANLRRGGLEKLNELREMIDEYKKTNPTEDELGRLSDLLYDSGLRQPEKFGLKTTEVAKARADRSAVDSSLDMLKRYSSGRDDDISLIMTKGTTADAEAAAKAIASRNIYDQFRPELLYALGKKVRNADVLFHAMLRLPEATVLKCLDELRTTEPEIYATMEANWSEEVTRAAAGLEQVAERTIKNYDPDGHYEIVKDNYARLKKMIDVAQEAGFTVSDEARSGYEAAVETCRSNGLTFNESGEVVVGVPAVFGEYVVPRLKSLKAIVDHFFTRKNGNGNGKKGNGANGAHPVDAGRTATLATVAADIRAGEAFGKVGEDNEGERGLGFYEQYNGKGTMALPIERNGERVDKERELDLPGSVDGVININIHGFQGYVPLGFPLGERVESRFYITLDPATYAQNVNAMVDALQPFLVGGPAAGKFCFKVMPVSRPDGSIPRRDQIVIYFKSGVGKEVRAAVEAAMDKVARANPSAFSVKGPYFTMKLRDGLFFGEEPKMAGESFGTGRAGALDAAEREINRLEAAGVTVDSDLRTQIVAYYFEKCGFDPENPAFNLEGREERGDQFEFLYKRGTRPVTSQIAIKDIMKVDETTPRIQVEFQEEAPWPEGKEKLILGRATDADIFVADDTAKPGISRKQAELVREEDGTIGLHQYGPNPTVVRKFDMHDRYLGEVVLEKGKSPEAMILEPGHVYKLRMISGEGPKMVVITVPESRPAEVTPAAVEASSKPSRQEAGDDVVSFGRGDGGKAGGSHLSQYQRQMGEKGGIAVEAVKARLGSRCTPSVEGVVAKMFTEDAVRTYKAAPEALAEDMIYSPTKGQTISPKEMEFMVAHENGGFKMLGEPGKPFTRFKEVTRKTQDDYPYMLRFRVIVNPETGEVVRVRVTTVTKPGEPPPGGAITNQARDIKEALERIQIPVSLFTTPEDMK